MKRAEKLFNETYARWLQATAAIHVFRQIFIEIEPVVTHAAQEQVEIIFKGLDENSSWEGISLEAISSTITVDIQSLVRATGPASGFHYEEIAKGVAEKAVKSSYASLDAAVLIFCHSILDAAVFDYCRVIIAHAPKDWQEELRDTRVKLVEAQGRSYKQLLLEKLDERLEKLERESLLVKIGRLFAKCNPPAGWSPMDGYIYEEQKLKDFDSQRHEIVHGHVIGKPLRLFPPSDENISYITSTGIYFMHLIKFKYGLQIDPEFLLEVIP